MTDGRHILFTEAQAARIAQMLRWYEAQRAIHPVHGRGRRQPAFRPRVFGGVITDRSGTTNATYDAEAVGNPKVRVEGKSPSDRLFEDSSINHVAASIGASCVIVENPGGTRELRCVPEKIAVDECDESTWKDVWTGTTEYAVGDMVRSGGGLFACKSAHTSSSSTEPGVGASWTSVWDAQFRECESFGAGNDQARTRIGSGWTTLGLGATAIMSDAIFAVNDDDELVFANAAAEVQLMMDVTFGSGLPAAGYTVELRAEYYTGGAWSPIPGTRRFVTVEA